jgi:hypothetical protein
LTVSAGSVAATDLTGLDGKTSVAVNASAATTITGTAAEVQAAYTVNTAGTISGLGDEAVTISDTTITATVLNSLDTATSGVIDASSVTAVSGLLADLNTLYNSAGISGLGNENITITDSGIITSTVLNDLIGETSGTISIGTVTINVASGDTLNLSSVTSTGTITINDAAGNENITGTSAADILNLTSGDDTINLGGGNDTINIAHSNIDINDNITDTSGTDILNITSSGMIDSANLIDVSGIETLNLSSGDDTITFDDVTEFNNFRTEFSNIVDAGGTDNLSFGLASVIGDLDFTNLSEFENLNLSSSADNLTVSGDEPANIFGLDGDDIFTLNFSNLTNLNAGNDTDTVALTGNTGTSISADTVFGKAAQFDNIETLDMSNLTLNTADANTEFEITSSLIDEWTDADNDLTLVLNGASQADQIKFTDVGVDGLKGTGDDRVFDGQANVASAGTYTLDETTGTTLTIDLIP